MKIAFLVLILTGIAVVILVTARWLSKRVRTGGPVHSEFRDEWMGDDTPDGEN